jgi:hypothetical protein
MHKHEILQPPQKKKKNKNKNEEEEEEESNVLQKNKTKLCTSTLCSSLECRC